MPHITDSVELIKIYNPRQRKKTLPSFNWLYLHTTAMNVASIVWAVHEAGYVLGDIKPQNLLVNNRALPAIVDTDSFQVRHPITGKVFRCLVGSEGFTPPELLNQELANVTQAEVHDRFRLAMMIYLLLFGEHPFKGKWTGVGESPEPAQLIQQGFWPYGKQRVIQPGPLTIPLNTIHPGLENAFLQCFNQGHQNPEARPSAHDWVRLLKRAIADLEPCPRQKSHYYATSATFTPQSHRAKSKVTNSNAHCYWCYRTHELGVDVFSSQSVNSTTHQTETHRAYSPQPKASANASVRPTTKSRAVLPKSPLPHSSARPTLTRSANPTAHHPIPTTSPLSNHRYWGLGYVTLRHAMSALHRVLSHPKSVAQIPALVLGQQWVRVSGAIAFCLSMFAILISTSRTYITAEEMGPTILGGIACLGLVMLGALWLRLLKHYNLQDN